MKWLGLFILAFGALLIVGFACNWFSDAAKTAQKEYSASALLKKYEYFKDLSAAIDKKRADIEVYRSELENYTVVTSDDKFYLEQRKSELFGIVAMHNQLCADYNSQMSKFNYRFTNKGDLPASNLEPLPREYRAYILTLKNTK
jgi:hypothetical protein